MSTSLADSPFQWLSYGSTAVVLTGHKSQLCILRETPKLPAIQPNVDINTTYQPVNSPKAAYGFSKGEVSESRCGAGDQIKTVPRRFLRWRSFPRSLHLFSSHADTIHLFQFSVWSLAGTMVFTAPSWVPKLKQEPYDSIPISEFMLNEQFGRHPLQLSRPPFTCGLSGAEYSITQVRERVHALASSLSKELGFLPNKGSEWDKVICIYSLNTVRPQS